MPPKLTPPDITDLYRLYESGQTINQIASGLGRNPKTVTRWFDNAGLARRNGGRPRKRPDDATLRRLYVDERLSSTDIGRQFDMRPEHVRRLLQRIGVSRSASEAKRVLYAKMTSEQRQQIAAAAHAAVRGMKRSDEDLKRRAIGKHLSQSHVGPAERTLAGWLAQRGIPCVLQAPEGPFNVDVAIPGVAVEIFGGSWHGSGRHAARHPRRTRYLLDRGWSVVVVWVEGPYPLTIQALEYVVALSEEMRRDEAAPRQYRVIRGTGQELIRGCAQDDYFPIKPARERRRAIWCPHQAVSDEAIGVP